MLTNRPAVLIAVVAGALASSVAFMSDAGVEDRRAEYAPIRVATAVFAGGCVSCVEADFDRVAGVIETVPGYTGGAGDQPTYKQVAAGGTGHYEAVKVTYDPSRISYEDLATSFIRSIDPTDDEGQFCDRGESYRSAIFVSGQSERAAAAATVSGAQRLLGKEVVTEIRPLMTFWPAEEQYQDYALKNAAKYASQREACGRDKRLMEVWGTNAPAL
ncbi:MAG: peptide-methionine (S)-S-oxide reductase [Alphaproteobacteria bacterium HGW-Alphaproteobacteria-18]|nr:MAG: peptide-methionine (S)-S-oxide reductase [Alphaproteobacteria bacterium HGW-Alphaproteobacteria-18]